MEHELVRINKVLPEILKKTSPTFCLKNESCDDVFTSW